MGFGETIITCASSFLQFMNAFYCRCNIFKRMSYSSISVNVKIAVSERNKG